MNADSPVTYIDTHSHLYVRQFDGDRVAVTDRARAVLEAVFLPNVDRDSVEEMLRLTAQAPDFFFPMIGLHPSHVKEGFEAELEHLKTLLDDPAYTWYGIGETGIDLYWDKSTLALQQESLRIQVGWAKAYGLPIILHAREAIDETADLIEAHLDERLWGIFHCFDGTLAQAERIIGLGNFKLGIGGIVTYREDVQQMVKQVSPTHIVLETDSPYLPPVPHRKDKPRRNESSYTHYVGEKLAELWKLSPAEVAQITNANAAAVFTRYTANSVLRNDQFPASL
jgi:TatD DNase family protein